MGGRPVIPDGWMESWDQAPCPVPPPQEVLEVGGAVTRGMEEEPSRLPRSTVPGDIEVGIRDSGVHLVLMQDARGQPDTPPDVVFVPAHILPVGCGVGPGADAVPTCRGDGDLTAPK